MADTEQATLADMVIGPERRKRLIERYADGLALEYGMTLDAARRYATDVYEDGHANIRLAIGQVWTKREGKPVPGGDLLKRWFGEGAMYTVLGFAGDMVQIGQSPRVLLHASQFEDMWLVSWPEEYQLDGPSEVA